MCKQLFCGQNSLRMTKPLGKTGSKPLWSRAWVWFVIVQMWETETSSHPSPWSLMEGAKMILTLPVCGKADTLDDELMRKPAEWPSPQSPEVLQSGSPSITKLAASNMLEAVLCLKPDTCLPVTDTAPQAILWAERSSIQNKHLSPRARVLLNRVQIECPKTLMLFYFLNVCRDSWSAFPPTSQDLLTGEGCHY